jgi:hypothetical protein
LDALALRYGNLMKRTPRPNGFSVITNPINLLVSPFPAEAMSGKACCDLLMMFIVIVLFKKGIQEGARTFIYIFFALFSILVS